MPPMENFLVLLCHLIKMKHEMSYRGSGFAEVHVLFPVSSSQAGVTECTPCTPVQPFNKETGETQIYLKLLEHAVFQP